MHYSGQKKLHVRNIYFLGFILLTHMMSVGKLHQSFSL